MVFGDESHPPDGKLEGRSRQTVDSGRAFRVGNQVFTMMIAGFPEGTVCKGWAI